MPGDQAMDWGPFDVVEIPLSGHLQLEIIGDSGFESHRTEHILSRPFG